MVSNGKEEGNKKRSGRKQWTRTDLKLKRYKGVIRLMYCVR